MPSPRKRIGFLPRSEVKNIIDKISKHNKLSQSKVTGILVEEALNTRGILNSQLLSLSTDFDENSSNSFGIFSNSFDGNTCEDYDNLKLSEGYNKEDVEMINDFIAFKFFKKIMNQNKKNL